MDQVAPTMLQILTAEPKEILPTQALVYFERKNTDKNPVSESEKYRGVLVTPPYVLPGASESLHEVFADAISEAFYDAAGKVLKEYIETHAEKYAVKEVSSALFTFENIITKMQQAQTSTKYTGEQIGAWFDASKTAEDATKKYGSKEDKKYQNLRAKYQTLASNNPTGISPNAARIMLASFNTEEVNHPVVKMMAKKLERLSKETADEL